MSADIIPISRADVARALDLPAPVDGGKVVAMLRKPATTAAARLLRVDTGEWVRGTAPIGRFFLRYLSPAVAAQTYQIEWTPARNEAMAFTPGDAIIVQDALLEEMEIEVEVIHGQ